LIAEQNTSSGVYVGFSDTEIITRVQLDYPQLFQDGGVLRDEILSVSDESNVIVDYVYVEESSIEFSLLTDKDYEEGTTSGQYHVKKSLF
jgi:hypothetical protein